jgi:rhodanese-related sulfurtransferase
MKPGYILIGILILLFIYHHIQVSQQVAQRVTSVSKCFSCLTPNTAVLKDSSNAANTKIHINYDVLIDVRTDEEWLEGHVPNAIHISLEHLVTDLPKLVPNKSSTILFCCKRGIRASGAETIAKRLGYTNVTHLEGKCSDLI